MANKKRKRKRRGGRQSGKKRGGGLMIGMRTGFKGITDSVTGSDTSGKYKWWGRIITVLLVAAAIGLLANRL